MDETGSMASQGEDPVTGLNRYIDNLNADSEIYSTTASALSRVGRPR
jgi:hypothetical protein